MSSKRKLDFHVILNFKASHSPVQLWVVKEKSLQKREAHWMPRHHEGLEYNCMIERYSYPWVPTVPICSTYIYGMLCKRRLKLLVILSLWVSHSPVQLCVVKEKSLQKRGAHWMPRHHEKKFWKTIVQLKNKHIFGCLLCPYAQPTGMVCCVNGGWSFWSYWVYQFLTALCSCAL